MAKRIKDLQGWKFLFKGFDEENSKNDLLTMRKSKRNTNNGELIYLRRKIDGLEIHIGDTVLFKSVDDKKIVAMVKEISLGCNNYLDLNTFLFIEISDIGIENLSKLDEYSKESIINEDEIFLTDKTKEFYLKDFINKIDVFSENEYENFKSNKLNKDKSVFFTKRFYDINNLKFSSVFDFSIIKELKFSNHKKLFDFIKSNDFGFAEKKYINNNFNENLQVEQINHHDFEFDSPSKIKSSKLDFSNKNQEHTSPNNKNKRKNSTIIKTPIKINLDLINNIIDQKNISPINKKKSEINFSSNKLIKINDNKLDYSPTKQKKRKFNDIEKKSTKNQIIEFEKNSLDYVTSILSPLKKKFKIKSDKLKLDLNSISPKKSSIINNDVNKKDPSKSFNDLKSELFSLKRNFTLLGREDEFSSIFFNLESSINLCTGTCLYISGTPGTGKTETVREVIYKLKDLIDKKKMNDFDYCEINGLKILKPSFTYEILWEKISGLKVSSSNALILLEKYFLLEPKNKPLVLLLDELDHLLTKNQSLMYNLFNWPTYCNSNLIVIAIANTMDLPERVLSNKISSRLGLKRIQFVSYTYSQIELIIQHRLKMISNQNEKKVIINSDAIGFVSRKVAFVSGDARRALSICRRAIDIAEEDYLNCLKKDNSFEKNKDAFHVLISHFSKAINETVNSLTSKMINSLSFSSKLVLVSIIILVKKKGLADNLLGEIIDQINLVLDKLLSNEKTNSLNLEDNNILLNDLLIKSNFINSFKSNQKCIRIRFFKEILNELVELGILVQQDILSERYRLVNYCVSEQEIISIIRRDQIFNLVL